MEELHLGLVRKHYPYTLIPIKRHPFTLTRAFSHTQSVMHKSNVVEDQWEDPTAHNMTEALPGAAD